MAIMASLNANATTNKITPPWASQYTVGEHLVSLPLFKVIIHESHIDTNVMTHMIHEDLLSSLDKHVGLQGYNIDKLNTFV
jgi:hypothetical protein